MATVAVDTPLHLTDADLASVRDRDALYSLASDQRTDWRQFWEEVDHLLWRGEVRK